MKKDPKLDWIGGLREYRDKYTALELQKKALEWRENLVRSAHDWNNGIVELWNNGFWKIA